jgi:CRISPR-associated protein Cas1
MAWRGVHLTKPARLTLANRQLLIEQDDGEVRVAIEDVAWIVLDTQQVSLTGSLLSACMDAGIAIISCDSRHTPCGISLPFHNHYRQPAIGQAQIEMGLPLKKRIWQVIVKRKIKNQARALEKNDSDGCSALHHMSGRVRSGDPSNVEARAARFYWSHLLEDFTRSDSSDKRNKLLNYGYAIVRAAVARSIVANGLLPAFGVNHASITNAFNLADDLIEPFRPFVDCLSCNLAGPASGWKDELTKQERQSLAGILLDNCVMGTERVSLLVASEMVSASLVRAIERKSAQELVLPQFLNSQEQTVLED